jgi:hypothetical protein
MVWVWALALLQDSHPEEYGRMYRDSWGTLSYIYPTQLDGKIFSFENGVGSRQDFHDTFDISVDFAFEINVHYAVDPEGGYMVINFSGVWFSGRGPALTAPTPYGGQVYPPGTSFHSEGHWLWYELGYGYQFDVVGDSFQVYGAFTFAGDNWEIVQTQRSLPTNQYMSTYTVQVGGRGGAVFRPLPFVAVGVEAGAWIGGLRYDRERDVTYNLSSWSTLVNFYVSADLAPTCSVRFGYSWRAVSVESDHTHPANGAIPRRDEDDDAFMRFGGPVFSIELHY